MSDKTRYRIGIDEKKMFDWPGWYSDFNDGAEIVEVLADAIARDVEKFTVYQVKPRKELSPEDRAKIVSAALKRLAEKISN